MGKYDNIAQSVATSIAGAIHESEAVDRSLMQTANNMVADLQEFSADMTAAFKKQVPSLGATVTASPWKKDKNVVKATVSVTRGGQTRDIPVEFSIGMSNVKVDGQLIENGQSPASVIAEHVHRFLSS